ncbi:MAG: beta-lactamase domain protein, partial [Marmoricola sp.]|nr:beta-lactamase domain protein [Marmoricola sp.]
DQVAASVQRLGQDRPDLLASDDLARAVVEDVYADVDEVLWGAAELSVRAQLQHLGTHA